MLGAGLRKLCPQDSFGYAFREKKTVRESTPGGCKTGPRGVQNGLREASGRLFCATWPPRRRVWAALGALLGRFSRSSSRLGGLLGVPGLLPRPVQLGRALLGLSLPRRLCLRLCFRSRAQLWMDDVAGRSSVRVRAATLAPLLLRLLLLSAGSSAGAGAASASAGAGRARLRRRPGTTR